MVAPATVVDPAELRPGLEGLRSLGLQVEVASHCYDQWGLFAGRDESRAADLEQAWLDPGVRAVIAAKGGYGCMRLLPLLSWSKLRVVPPKVLLGFSDVTALHLAWGRHLQVVTFHGPMPSVDPEQGWSPAQLRGLQEVLFGQRPVSGAVHTLPTPYLPGQPVYAGEPSRDDAGEPATAWLWQNPPGQPAPTYWQLPAGGWQATGGRVGGRLLGGNLSLLAALTGTEYLQHLFVEPFVLFIEDVDEAPYRLDRMLTQLELAGVLARAAGFVVGEFTHCEPKPPAVPGAPAWTWLDVVRERLCRFGQPVLGGVAAGHGDARPTFPLGVEVYLDPQGLWFVEPGTSPRS